MRVFLLIYLPFKIKYLYSMYIMLKKKKFQNNTEQIQIIQNHFNQNYKLLDVEHFGPNYDDYYDSYDTEKKDIIFRWSFNYWSYKNNKYRNICTEIIKRDAGSYKKELTKKESLIYYEFTLDIHIELIKKIEASLEKFNNYYDFLVIYMPQQINFKNNNFKKKEVSYDKYEEIVYLTLIIAERFDLYFKFDLISVFYDEYTSFLYPRMVVFEFFLCIKKNKFLKFSSFLDELKKLYKLPLDFEIKKIENNVDFFTRKNFYNQYFQEVNILNYQIMSFHQSFYIFNYNLYLDVFYELGFYLNLINLHRYDYSDIKQNFVDHLTDQYIYTRYFYEKNDYYKTKNIKKYTRLYLKGENTFIYVPSIFRLYCTKYLGNIIFKIDRLKSDLVNKVHNYIEKDKKAKFDSKKFYIKLFSFLVLYYTTIFLYNYYK